jgi:DNA polymerase I
LVQDSGGEGEGSIRVLYNKRGMTDYALYDEAGITARTGVHPTKYAEYASMRGDTSDNLPGVPGVGEKTAAKLINDYGDLDGVFANLDKCTPKLRENLRAYEAQVRSNMVMTPLVRDVPDVSIENVHPPKPDMAAARKLFTALEFRALTERVLSRMSALWGAGSIDSEPVVETQRLVVDVTTVSEPSQINLDGVVDLAIVGQWVGAEGRSALVGVAIASGDAAQWVPIDVLVRANEQLSAAFASGTRRLHAHKAKELLRSLHDYGINIASTEALGIDTAIAAYLLKPSATTYTLEEVSGRYGIDLRAVDAAPPGELDFGGTAEDPSVLIGRHAVGVLRVAAPMRAAMDARSLLPLYEQIERPLIGVLARMEAAGVRVDTGYLKELAQELTDEAHIAEAEVHAAAGEVFLVNSVPQLRAILFDKLGLKTDKKTKTGYSTDAQSLEKLRGEHPIIEPLLRYREMEKLRSTYGESLLNEVAADGRIHASFNQTVARTGRLSSDQPNLHNIPIRSEEGRRFRKAFIPADGRTLLVADYNQIELRVIAHLAQDPGLIEAFTTGADVHTETAKRVFHVEANEVTLAMRSKAKMVSYGLAYGVVRVGSAPERAGVRSAGNSGCILCCVPECTQLYGCRCGRCAQ